VSFKLYVEGGGDSKPLSRNLDVEKISKKDVYSGLNRATRNTQKGDYSKGSHSFEILARLNPGCVQETAPSAKRFLDALRSTIKADPV